MLVSAYVNGRKVKLLSLLETRIETLESHIKVVEHRLDNLHAQKPSSTPQKESIKASSVPKVTMSDEEIFVPENHHTQTETEYESFDQWDEIDNETDNAEESRINSLNAFDFDVAKSTFEKYIATKVPVWIGALSLICAAFFMVKYSLEAGLLGPETRLTMGGVFGVGLIYLGHWILKRPNIANAHRISQGLIGAGLASLYGCIYSATHLHEFLPNTIGFAGMVVITALAVISSIRYGQAIAVFGLIGGFLTPALLGSSDPDAIVLFSYLFVLFSGSLFVLIRQGWWFLSGVCLFACFGWSSLWIVTSFSPADSTPIIVFVMGLASIILTATARKVIQSALPDMAPIHSLNAIAVAGALLTIIWVGSHVTMGLFDWSMIGLLSLGVFALYYFDPHTYERPAFLKIGAILIVLALWIDEASGAQAMIVLSGLSMLYLGVPAFIMRHVTNPMPWAWIQNASAFVLYFMAYTSLEPQYDIHWPFMCLILSGLACLQAHYINRHYNADEGIKTKLISLYAFCASAFISIGLTTALPFEYAPLAIAGQIFATSLLYRKLALHAFEKIISLLCFVFVFMNVEQILLIASVAIASLFGETVPSSTTSSILSAPLLQLGGAGVLMALARHAFPINAASKRNVRVQSFLTYLASALFATLAYYGYRYLLSDGAQNPFLNTLEFVERGTLSILIGFAGAMIMYYARKQARRRYEIVGHVLATFAFARIIYFDMILYNPLFHDSQLMGHVPILNGVTLVYGVGALIAAIMISVPMINASATNTHSALKRFYEGFGAVSLFAFVSLTVRHYFHGSVVALDTQMSAAELYSYSAIWLVTGIVLLILGIKTSNKVFRMVSVAFILLAITKVFLVDASELEGMLRVVSFLGLGVVLIGLSMSYTKFVMAVNNTTLKDET